jgi:hypothetical protein
MDLAGQGVNDDDLVTQILLSRGVPREDLARHRAPTLRAFLPDPSVFADMDRAAHGWPMPSSAPRRSPSMAIMTWTAPPARRC